MREAATEDKNCMAPLTRGTCVVTFLETGSRVVAAGQLVFNGNRVSIWEWTEVLEVDGGMAAQPCEWTQCPWTVHC